LAAELQQVRGRSTGVIGVPLPVERILKNCSGPGFCARVLAARLRLTQTRAIMTTDTRPKPAPLQLQHWRVVPQCALRAALKGAGMNSSEYGDDALVCLHRRAVAPRPSIALCVKLSRARSTAFPSMATVSPNDTAACAREWRSGA